MYYVHRFSRCKTIRFILVLPIKCHRCLYLLSDIPDQWISMKYYYIKMIINLQQSLHCVLVNLCEKLIYQYKNIVKPVYKDHPWEAKEWSQEAGSLCSQVVSYDMWLLVKVWLYYLEQPIFLSLIYPQFKGLEPTCSKCFVLLCHLS